MKLARANTTLKKRSLEFSQILNPDILLKVTWIEFNQNPGPGAYNISDAEKSTRKRILFASIGSKHKGKYTSQTSKENLYKNIKDCKNKAPGPGTYDNPLAINSQGLYPTTYVPNVITNAFVYRRDKLRINNVPGPGNYQSPSDFGIYASSKHFHNLKQNPANWIIKADFWINIGNLLF